MNKPLATDLKRPRARLALVALALTLAACGAGGDDEVTTSPAPRSGPEAPSGAPPSAPDQFPPESLECMADHGIDAECMADHGIDAESPEEILHAPGAQREFEACVEFLHPGDAP